MVVTYTIINLHNRKGSKPNARWTTNGSLVITTTIPPVNVNVDRTTPTGECTRLEPDPRRRPFDPRRLAVRCRPMELSSRVNESVCPMEAMRGSVRMVDRPRPLAINSSNNNSSSSRLRRLKVLEFEWRTTEGPPFASDNYPLPTTMLPPSRSSIIHTATIHRHRIITASLPPRHPTVAPRSRPSPKNWPSPSDPISPILRPSPSVFRPN